MGRRRDDEDAILIVGRGSLGGAPAPPEFPEEAEVDVNRTTALEDVEEVFAVRLDAPERHAVGCAAGHGAEIGAPLRRRHAERATGERRVVVARGAMDGVPMSIPPPLVRPLVMVATVDCPAQPTTPGRPS